MDNGWFIPAFFLIAFLYGSVGHGGGSGYLAALSFGQFKPDVMATTALTLNLFVAGTSFITFSRAGHLKWNITWPFVVASVPGAWLGGLTVVTARGYSGLLAAALLFAAARLAVDLPPRRDSPRRSPSLAIALPLGGAIGWLSGMVGVGGGIFLSPLLLLLDWATPKQAAAASAGFIVANSGAGLFGRVLRHGVDYGRLWPLLLAALVGGFIGARLGADHFSGKALKRLLSVALVVAAIRMMMRALG